MTSPRPTPLRPFLGALTRFAGSDLAERYGLRQVTDKLLYRGLRGSLKAGNLVRAQFGAALELAPGDLLRRKKSGPSARFDLTPSDEQKMTREMLHGFALDTLRPAGAQLDHDPSELDGVLEQLAELALNVTAIPEALDGVGEHREPVSSVLMAEDLAYGDMSLAIAAMAPRGFVTALTELGSRAQQAKYLPPFTEEQFVPAAVAVVDPGVQTDANRPRCRASLDGDGYRLDGSKVFVPLADRAEVFLVTAQLDGVGPRGFIVRADAEGIRTRTEGAMAHTSAAMGRVTLTGVRVAASDMLGEDEVPYDHQRLIDLGRLGACALAVGTSQAVLDYVVEYGNDRIAFGEPITHKQSVAFLMADIAIEVEGMRLMMLRAAGLAERGADFHEAVYLAHLHCTEHGMKIGSAGVQLLGGHGYVKEHPVERWYRQLRSIPMLEGAVVA